MRNNSNIAALVFIGAPVIHNMSRYVALAFGLVFDCVVVIGCLLNTQTLMMFIFLLIVHVRI
jgi:hypothetical protein